MRSRRREKGEEGWKNEVGEEVDKVKKKEKEEEKRKRRRHLSSSLSADMLHKLNY